MCVFISYEMRKNINYLNTKQYYKIWIIYSYKETKEIMCDESTTHCSILHMGGNFQKLYTHEIPIQKKIKEPRISFTFRKHNM